MILVIGGAFQHKKQYAMQTFGLTGEDFTDGAACSEEELFGARAVLHFHEYIRRCVAGESGVTAKEELPELAEQLKTRNSQVLLIANELGSGVIPAEAFDREYRECAGRVCCDAADRAEQVHRVVCGIGTVIKHA